MMRFPGSVVILVVVAASFVRPAPAAAQWLHYPTAGVPRTEAGVPNLNAPAPKTADGKPDFSGIWATEDNRPCPPGGCPDMKVGQEFVDIGWSVKGGLPYQPWAADAVKARRAANGGGDPTTRCLPGGIVKGHTTAFLRKIVQVPGLVVLLNESNASYRQIFTDGRPLPADPEPSFNGYSSGRWEGDTLVVQSNGFHDGLWLDRSGSPLTDAAQMTERIRRVSYGKMEIEITITDLKAYTRPWTVKLNHFIVLDTDLLDAICLENEKDVVHLVK
ncbi:MAG TPA: hypothetical protein VNG89_17310 [Vicinamibacterales bacterium]|nr:hypothetical protein [Vicinamibacterales bacterium]